METLISKLETHRETILSWGPYFKQPKRGPKPEKGAQIDLLIQKRDNIVLLIECKFTQDPVSISVIKEVEEKILNK